MTELRQTIERFIASCTEPALAEPGEELMHISQDNFSLEAAHGSLQLQAWSDRRNLVRRVTGVNQEVRGKLVLSVEHFGKRAGTLSLLDLQRPAGQDATLKSERLEFREQFYLFLRRQFPMHRVAELTTEADLEHSLSPAFPRALIRQGSQCWAAIGSSQDPFHAERVLTFGLIWLDYLRGREPDLAIQGLVLYLPAGHEKLTCLRLLFLNPKAAQFAVFLYDDQGFEAVADLKDYGNLNTRLDPHCRRIPGLIDKTTRAILEELGAESIPLSDGELSLRVNGLEFARTVGTELLFGIHRKRAAAPHQLNEIVTMAEQLVELRSAGAVNHLNPLYLANPESWLESQVRAHIEELDALLLPAPLYGQVPSFAAVDRGVLDLLAADCTGRLAVLELKASQDIHLPLQALDYWMRVKWHVDRAEFAKHGYFPGLTLNNEPPRLLLVSPALDFHPANECILRFFSTSIPVERIGVGLQWRKELKVMSRS